MTRVLRKVAAVFFLLAPAIPVSAQRFIPADVPRLPVSLAVDDATGTTASAVIVESEPNAVRVLAIAIPEEARGCRGTYELIEPGSFSVLGRLRGSFTPADGNRALALSVSVPRAAPAGRSALGVMRFRCEDARVADVPLFLNVRPNRVLHLEPVRALVGASAGKRFSAEIIVRNAGNSREHVSLRAVLPDGWRARPLTPGPLSVEPGLSVTIPLEVAIAGDAVAGDYGVVIKATSRDGTEAATAFTVRVNSGRAGATGSPSLSTGVLVGHDFADATVAAYTADLTGTVMPGVNASAKLNLMPRSGGESWMVERSLNRLGASRNDAHLALRSAHWETGLGNIGHQRRDLVGTSLWGLGARGGVELEKWRGNVFGAQPRANTGTGGHYFVADLFRRTGSAWTGLLFNDLHDRTGVGRAARVIAADVSVPLENAHAQLQVGSVQRAGNNDLAWLTRLERRTPSWGGALAASHVPGGSASFAQSSEELTADAYRVFARRVTVSGTYWKSRNEGLSTRDYGMLTSGWSAGQRVMLGSLGAISVDARAARFEGSNDLGTFTGADRRILAEWSGSLAIFNARAGVSRGVIERGTRLGGISVSSDADRSAFFGSIGATGGFGQFQVDIDRQSTGPGVGAPLEQTTLSARGDMIPLIPGRATLYAETMLSVLGVSRRAATTQIIGVRARVSGSLQLTLDAERSGFQASGGARAPWVVTTRIQRSFGLSPLRSPVRRGVVFADLDNDGVQSPREKGVSGVVVNLDGSVVITDAAGRFDPGLTAPHLVTVDPRSLPGGWVAAPQASGKRSNMIALAVVPTSRVEVKLSIVDGPGLDPERVSLRGAVVILSDSVGRSWTGTPDERGLLQFDALPPGLYEVSADLSALAEILVLPDVLPRVHVQGGGTIMRVELRVGPRPIRPAPDRSRSLRLGGGSSDVPPRNK